MRRVRTTLSRPTTSASLPAPLRLQRPVLFGQRLRGGRDSLPARTVDDDDVRSLDKPNARVADHPNYVYRFFASLFNVRDRGICSLVDAFAPRRS